LWYPVIVASITLVLGALLVREKRGVSMHD
jgi:hypothetical protein